MADAVGRSGGVFPPLAVEPLLDPPSELPLDPDDFPELDPELPPELDPDFPELDPDPLLVDPLLVDPLLVDPLLVAPESDPSSESSPGLAPPPELVEPQAATYPTVSARARLVAACKAFDRLGMIESLRLSPRARKTLPQFEVRIGTEFW